VTPSDLNWSEVVVVVVDDVAFGVCVCGSVGLQVWRWVCVGGGRWWRGGAVCGAVAGSVSQNKR